MRVGHRVGRNRSLLSMRSDSVLAGVVLELQADHHALGRAQQPERQPDDDDRPQVACTQIGGSNNAHTRNTRGTVMMRTMNMTNTAGPSPPSMAPSSRPHQSHVSTTFR